VVFFSQNLKNENSAIFGFLYITFLNNVVDRAVCLTCEFLVSFAFGFLVPVFAMNKLIIIVINYYFCLNNSHKLSSLQY